MRSVEQYEQAKAAMVVLVERLSADELAQQCRACPAWSIQDVVAHHVHSATDYLDGLLPADAYEAITGANDDRRTAAAAARDAWTASGVQARRGLELGAVLTEWEAVVARMDDKGAAVGLDLVVHLDDIAETLGAEPPPAARDDAMGIWYHAFVVSRLATIGAAVDLVATDTGRRWSNGADNPTVTGPAYDLLRVVSGRRTRAEADAAIDWCDTPEATRALLPVYGWPT